MSSAMGLRLLAAVLAISTSACAAGTAGSPGEAAGSTPGAGDASADTILRGRIAVVGSEPTAYAVLRPDDQSGEVALTGDLGGALRRLSGLEVEVRGSIAGPGRRMSVTGVSVRALDDVPAVDGILRRAGDELFLETSAGRRSLGETPAGMEELVGAWIWVAGEAGRPVEAYGLIDPEP